jgi:glycerol-3-phosphate dehydrogenase
VLRHVNKYFDISATRNDVTSAWCGLRPLVENVETENTAQIVREHLILTSASGLLSITGGKWTSYRKMAEEAVDQAVHIFNLNRARACRSERLPLLGAEKFDRNGDQSLIRSHGLDADIARHLNHAFGDQAGRVADLAKSGLAARLHPDHPYIEAEVVYAVRHELAAHAADVLTRRLPMALVDTAAAKIALPRVIELMAAELEWPPERCRNESETCMQRLNVAI